MKHYIHDRGVQASAAAGAVIAVAALATSDYRPVYLALGVAWAAVTAVALVFAHRKAAG